jgi:hypothetical protein
MPVKAADTHGSTPSSGLCFTGFSQLPKEVQTLIWNFALPAPRLIHVYAEKGAVRHNTAEQDLRTFWHVWARKLPVPAILHTTQDSRSIGLKHYKLIFDSNERPSKAEIEKLYEDSAPLRRGRSIVINKCDNVLSGLQFPYHSKAMMYVDLGRDFVVTAHRNDMSKEEQIDAAKPQFKNMPIDRTNLMFNVSHFRKCMDRSILERIANFVITCASCPAEVFGYTGSRYEPITHPVYIMRDAFTWRDGEPDRLESDPPEMLGDSERVYGVNCGKDLINLLEKYGGPIPWEDIETFEGKVMGPYTWEYLEEKEAQGMLGGL